MTTNASRIHRVLGPDDTLLGDDLTWDQAWDVAEAWQRTNPLTADMIIRDTFGNVWIVWDCVTNVGN